MTLLCFLPIYSSFPLQVVRASSTCFTWGKKRSLHTLHCEKLASSFLLIYWNCLLNIWKDPSPFNDSCTSYSAELLMIASCVICHIVSPNFSYFLHICFYLQNLSKFQWRNSNAKHIKMLKLLWENAFWSFLCCSPPRSPQGW